ncbi:MAG: uracil-DNA glycosylase [Pyrinomonadaceae bacterium]
MSRSAEFPKLIADAIEQVLYLQELGVDSLNVKFSEKAVDSSPVLGGVGIPHIRSEISNLRSEVPKAEPRPTGSRLASLPSLLQRPTSAPPRGIGVSGTQIYGTSLGGVLPVATDTIEQIRAEIGPNCKRCKLGTLGRTQVVNSTGNANADLMFVGEAPGADEDEQGFPFVGRAGKLLTEIMMAIGFSRDDVFIGNINRCRPPGNRAPEPDETIACKPFLKREIAVVRPKVIVVLGATSAQNLLETKVPIGKLRGQFHDYLGTKVMPTFHPAYLLRDPHKKREVWEDMKMVRDYLMSVK